MEKINEQNELEMKESNEKILKRWRDLGFLQGLKEGSQNEWRCAKSFELMAQYLMTNEEKLRYTLCKSEATTNFTQTVTFPIIRRLICIERPRVNRIIQPEEILDVLDSVTLDQAIDVCRIYNKKIKGKETNKKKITYVNKIKDYYNLGELTFIDGISTVLSNTDAGLFRKVFDIDIEAEFLTVISKYLAIMLNAKNFKFQEYIDELKRDIELDNFRTLLDKK